MGSVTAKDVAALAGVSRSAVSRTFSVGASVAPETRRKVLDAADRIGYRPNGLASTLAKKHTDLVAVIANARPDLREPYLFHALHLALQAMKRQLITVSVSNDDDGRASLSSLIRFPIETAIVLADAVTPGNVAPFCVHGRPIMLNRRTDADVPADQVLLDEVSGLAAALADLQVRGVSRLWYVSGRASATASASRRLAFLEALAPTRMQVVGEEAGDYSYESGDRAFRRLAASGPLPDALVCANDAMAMGAMDAARILTDPADFARLIVLGFDNIPQSDWAPYRFSTVEQSIDDAVAAVAAILGGRDADPMAPPTVRIVPTRYVRR